MTSKKPIGQNSLTTGTDSIPLSMILSHITFKDSSGPATSGLLLYVI